MAMARNESVARMVMFLCFGTAILSLAVHWHTMKTTGQLNQSAFTTLRKNPTNRTDSGKNPSEGIGIGEVALAEPPSAANSSATKPKTRLVQGNQNPDATADTPKETKLAVPETGDNQKENNSPKGFFFPGIAQAKSVQGLEVNRTQVVVDLSDRRVYVYRYDEVIASYPIAVGKKGWETPTGDFQVIHKQHDPIWKHPITGEIFAAGTDSPLGDRWIGFWSDGRNEIGFHGTPNTDLIGAAVSHGCLRMRNSDVRMLYEQVKLGTSVLVRN
ncbi:L,D-transpeptidase [Sphaerospermopsis aphanizomenoides BCCUSP55]|uniref:L,D-transpeptidase n=1 Tax=Sphaerospermopsis aphanizomenoides TaxID=459663 RepID=UPI000B0AC2BC|nr:L,D-transpeptidase [Sphaerospermopsis aphanizomenoides]MBK1990799.1 L,D-transpeptidase [Sphaerospermopsis aphanizomenoides BCCUSP55]